MSWMKKYWSPAQQPSAEIILIPAPDPGHDTAPADAARDRKGSHATSEPTQDGLSTQAADALDSMHGQPSQRTQLWRRRALSKKGARMYSLMGASADHGSLAMLDHTGVVVSSYQPNGTEALNANGVVDRHMSQFYVPADVMSGLPLRDLRLAAVNGASTQMGWRLRPDGSAFWATSVIAAVMLRDGRLQGFSHVTREAPGPNGRLSKDQSDAAGLRSKNNGSESSKSQGGASVAWGLPIGSSS